MCFCVFQDEDKNHVSFWYLIIRCLRGHKQDKDLMASILHIFQFPQIVRSYLLATPCSNANFFVDSNQFPILNRMMSLQRFIFIYKGCKNHGAQIRYKMNTSPPCLLSIALFCGALQVRWQDNSSQRTHLQQHLELVPSDRMRGGGHQLKYGKFHSKIRKIF